MFRNLVIYITFLGFSSLFPQEMRSLKEYTSAEILAIGKKEYQNGFYEKGIPFLQEFYLRNPENLEGAIYLYKSFINVHDLQNSFNLISSLEVKNSNSVKIQILKGFYFFEKGDFSELEKLIQKLDNQNIEDPDFWMLKGDYYSFNNQNELSSFFYRKYISHFPGDSLIYVRIIRNLLEQNDITNSYVYLQKLRELFPQNIEYYKLLGDYYFALYLNKLKTVTFLKKKETLDPFLKESLLSYKTYYNYNEDNFEVINKILYISYLLGEKIHFLENVKDVTDPILKANYYELMNSSLLNSILRKSCENKEYVFSCFRYENHLKKINDRNQRFRRMKYYLSNIIKFDNIFKKRDIINYFLWANELYSGDAFFLEKRIQYYKSIGYFEDYLLDLYEILKLETSSPMKTKSKILIERLLMEKDKYLPFQIYSDIFPLLIKDIFKKNKKVILVFSPSPLSKEEKIFNESELIRKYMNNFINYLDYFEVLSDDDWQELRKRYIGNQGNYLFFDKDFLHIIREWEREKDQRIDYQLEIYYKIYKKNVYFNIFLREKNGVLVKSKEIIVKNLEDDILLASLLQNFLLEGVPLEGKMLKQIDKRIIINLGDVDQVKKDQIFFNNGNYYKVSEVYPYISVLEIVKGKTVIDKTIPLFVRVSQS